MWEVIELQDPACSWNAPSQKWRASLSQPSRSGRDDDTQWLDSQWSRHISDFRCHLRLSQCQTTKWERSPRWPFHFSLRGKEPDFRWICRRCFRAIGGTRCLFPLRWHSSRVVCVLSLTEGDLLSLWHSEPPPPGVPGVATGARQSLGLETGLRPWVCRAFPHRSVCTLWLHFSLHSAEIIAHLGKSISNTRKKTRKEKGNFLGWSINLSLFCYTSLWHLIFCIYFSGLG